MTEIIQTYDGPGDDPQFASFFGFSGDLIAAGQFVIIDCPATGRTFLGQTASAQLNINRDALGQFHNTTINQLNCVANGRYDRSTVVREAQLYKLRILKDISDGVPKSVRRRPSIASVGRSATAEEVIRYLNMPPIDESLRIGTLIDTDIPVCFSMRIMMHHVLTAGSTGSGKSNTIANSIKGAQEMGACCILLDHKPDYQDMEKPNDEGDQPHFRGMENVSYWSLGESNRPQETAINVLASDLDPTVLAASIFYNHNESLQSEMLDTLLLYYRDDMQNQGCEEWNWDKFFQWIPPSGAQAKEKYGDFIDTKSYNAMYRKLRFAGRVPKWMKAKSYGGGHLNDEEFNLERLVAHGKIIVVRIAANAGGGRGYGLFLSFLLRKVYELKANRKITCPIATFIDEAQDIFNAGRTFRDAAAGMLSENIRKGRSMKIGYMIGVQSADAVPEEIRNNLNSQLIHRHNNSSQASEAMQRASKEQLAMTDTFGPGECLAYLFGSNAVVHCQMMQSPFMLTKND